MVIEDKLRENAERFPDKIALICGDEAYTYAQLYKAVSVKAASMENWQGRLVPLIATSTAEFLISYFAIHLAGAVAVPLHKDLPTRKFDDYSKLLEKGTVPKEVADILFTTGTTGNAKAVMISHQTIWANAENLVLSQGFNHDITFIINGPLNHIGSLSKIYPTIYVGGTIKIIDGMKDIKSFFTAIDTIPHKVATFLVPAAIRMLIALWKEELKKVADKIDFIETGAAPMAASDMKKFCELLPKSRLYNTYASTETGIISTYDYNDGESLAGCVGKSMKHSSFFITDDGHVACKGTTLMTGYWNDEEATEAVMRDGVIKTADLGYIDDKGRLRLQGRGDDTINIGGYKIAPSEVEEVALAFPTVKDCVCISAEHIVMGEILKLLVVPHHNFERKELITFLKDRLESYKIPVLYEEVNSIERTFNGKINRKFYALSQKKNTQ
ncbi:class I adenylate-forming enzyme family protein [Prevotella aurantiaca]|jgi:fatty-acid-coA ligase|uniref:class I adenylate-forming enzyme family protein n=1 Tax=Prevotella aurantiaca TaxID=596085 RepID=UPI002889960E|nr:class I adenylate-forming enzyme family protein [Prevotella aurantiaca]